MKTKIAAALLFFVLLITGPGVINSQVDKNTQPTLIKAQVPLTINCSIAKDVGVAGNLFQNDLYALANITKNNTPITDAVIYTGNVVLKYSTLYQRYQDRLYEKALPQSIEIIIKTKKGEVIRGGIIRDYEITILSPAGQSKWSSGSSLKVSWQFTGSPSAAELNVFDLSTSEHIFQLKNILKNNAAIPAKVFSPGNSYLIQVRGKLSKGKFKPAGIPLDQNSQFTYSSSYAVTVHINK